MSFRTGLPWILVPVTLITVTYMKVTKAIRNIGCLKRADTFDDFLTSKAGRNFVLGWSITESLYWWVFPDYLMLVAGGYVRRFHPKLVFHATVGTAIGGAGAYLIGRLSPSTGSAIVTNVPFVTEKMRLYTEQKLDEHGPMGVAYHPSSGVPFKVFSYFAGQRHLNFAAYLSLGAALRAVRFACFYTASFLLAKLLGERLRSQPAHYVLLLYTVLYATALAFLQKGQLLRTK